jgi:DNA-binding transcriptional LysR family regulator
MTDRLTALKLFTRVARVGSFTRAGRELGLSQPSASRVISMLEKEVGNSLLTRNTRGVRLTDAGSDYLARLEPILDALEEADHAARGTGELSGTLRLGLTSSLALREVIPRLPAFIERHPALRIDLDIDDERQSLLREGIDVGLRCGQLTDSTATARLVGVNQQLLVAAPDYLRRAGRPASPSELASHAVLIGPSGTKPDAWSFERDGRTVSVRVEGRLISSANEGAVVAAVAGLGIVSTGLWSCREDLARGALVQVLPEWRMHATKVHALFPAGRAAKPAARAFIDYLIGELRGGPYASAAPGTKTERIYPASASARRQASR